MHDSRRLKFTARWQWCCGRWVARVGRLDDDSLDWFRQRVDQAGGGNYQTLINDALRQHIRRAREPLEATLRRVIREELRQAG